MASLALFPVAGCSLGAGQHLPLNHVRYAPAPEKVASVGIATTGVVQWAEISDSLQSIIQFKPTEQSLLADASQTTSSANSQYGDSLAAALAATFAGTTVNRSANVATDAQGNVTTTLSRDTTQNTPTPQNASTNLTVVAPSNSLTAEPANVAAGTEAQLKYQVAKALGEEIAILNNQINSLVYRSGYRPYFVTIQISVLPLDHGYPYDSSIDLSFSNAAGNPIVVPLLITDSIENTRQSQMSDIVRQLGLSLSGNGGIVGASASLNRTLQQLDQTLSLRPNSLLSVAKLSDSSLRVRLGANAFGETYEMIPRSHIVSLVLLVPRAIAEEKNGAIRLFQINGTVQYRSAVFDPKIAPFEAISFPGEQFEIPYSPQATCPSMQSVPLNAGTFAAASTDALPVQVGIIGGGIALKSRRMEASLSFGATGNTGKFEVYAEDIRQTDFGLRVTFPDPSRFLPTKGTTRGKIKIVVHRVGDGDADVNCPAYDALYAPPPEQTTADAGGGKKTTPPKPSPAQTPGATDTSSSSTPATAATIPGVKILESTGPVKTPPL